MDISWHDPKLALSLLGNHAGLWRWEIATGYIQWSDHLLDMLGLHRDDFPEHFDFFIDRLHPDDRGLVQRNLEKHLASGQPYRLRCRMRHCDGHYVTMLTQGTSVRDDKGEVVDLIGTVLDLSEEVQASAQLAESEKSFESLAENVPGAIFRFFMNGDGTDGIEYMSSGCNDIWELTSAEIQGDASLLWGMVFDEDLPAMQSSVMESQKSLVPWRHRWRIRTPSGIVKHLEGRGRPTRLEDGTTLWNSLILDVSGEAAIRRELLSQQEMLGQAQKMEVIGRISGGIAHDFNNLLAIVMGNAELIDQVTADKDITQYAEDILEACKRGSSLTRHLLSFARKSQLRPEIIDVDRALRGIKNFVVRVLPENIEINTIRTAGLWSIDADVAFLENAILNLCINARDAMLNGGKLTIETSNIRISAEYALDRGEGISPGRYVMIAVTDNGVGIHSSDLHKVTEPFYSTKGPDMGSGLGLAMVDGFVRQSNGALRIYSEPGNGTTVKMFLPATFDAIQEQDRDQDAPAKGFSRAQKAKILVVEDEPGILKLLEVTLQKVGYQIEMAVSGDDAVARYGEKIGEFDLLLTDVVMPGTLQGPALARKLSEIAPSLKVIFMSGYATEAAVHGNGIRPTDQFLMKPIMRSQLLSCVESTLLKDG